MRGWHDANRLYDPQWNVEKYLMLGLPAGRRMPPRKRSRVRDLCGLGQTRSPGPTEDARVRPIQHEDARSRRVLAHPVERARAASCVVLRSLLHSSYSSLLLISSHLHSRFVLFLILLASSIFHHLFHFYIPFFLAPRVVSFFSFFLFLFMLFFFSFSMDSLRFSRFRRSSLSPPWNSCMFH